MAKRNLFVLPAVILIPLKRANQFVLDVFLNFYELDLRTNILENNSGGLLHLETVEPFFFVVVLKIDNPSTRESL